LVDLIEDKPGAKRTKDMRAGVVPGFIGMEIS